MSKTIVVTGTATGMGRAIVEKFAAEGWNVVATVRKEADLTVHDELERVRTLLLDVDDEQAAGPFAQTAVEQFGQVDVLVNNAGFYQMGPVEVSSMDQIHRQFQTNVFGLIALSRAFLPIFRAQRSGTIINISSLTAEQGYPYSAVYAASKAAVAALSEGMSLEVAGFGIAVKAVLPGQHSTRIFTKIDIAQDVPADYQAGIDAFFSKNPPTGSDPSITADVVYRAAVDGDNTKVRYYSAPDSAAIPRAKQILGTDGYWAEFRTAVLAEPSPLFTALIPRPGEHPIDWQIS
ncbi:SDR family NAD(P)-dependent oxidoreductase [Micromonospora parva]|uniref:SDR family NAD(P)-dependent oxidoreductase n=1 Tax=Micromonospora parva TaxID=1464048 RepID=UPI0033CDE5DD